MVDRLYLSLWVSRGVKSNWKDQDLLISFLDLYYRVGPWAHPILITMPTTILAPLLGPASPPTIRRPSVDPAAICRLPDCHWAGTKIAGKLTGNQRQCNGKQRCKALNKRWESLEIK